MSRAYEKAGCPVRFVDGGGSDANIMALHGITPIVVATGMKDVHTTNETLSVADLEYSAEFLLNLLTD